MPLGAAEYHLSDDDYSGVNREEQKSRKVADNRVKGPMCQELNLGKKIMIYKKYDFNPETNHKIEHDVTRRDGLTKITG